MKWTAPGRSVTKHPRNMRGQLTEFAKVMKWVDPDIKLVAAAVSIWEDFPRH